MRGELSFEDAFQLLRRAHIPIFRSELEALVAESAVDAAILRRMLAELTEDQQVLLDETLQRLRAS